jgi:peptide/nickel transport system permease protein
MRRYLARRLANAALTLLGVSLAVFLLLRAIPGDPARMMLPEGTPEEDVARLRVLLGLDRPLPVQYLLFLRDAARGDFGESIQHQAPAIALVGERLPATVELSLAALALALGVAIPAGIVAAVYRQTAYDHLATLAALAGQSIPHFWLGIMLILGFSVQLGWLPTSGRDGPGHLVLPTITLAAFMMALFARLTRSGMLEVLRADYVRTARAKGAREERVVIGHALKNAAIPLVTVVGLQFGALLGGAVVTETVFAWPGVGKLVIDAIHRRDYPVVQAVLLVSAALFIAINLLVDLAYAALDPRIRYE